MSISIWDYCVLDEDISESINDYQNTYEKLSNGLNSIDVNNNKNNNIVIKDINQTNDSLDISSTTQSTLVQAEIACRTFLENLDKTLTLLNDIHVSYSNVTGKTNSLISNCEALLEHQNSIVNNVDILTKAFKPFNEIEEISNILGLPLESTNPTSATVVQHAMSIDPRSIEFQNLLVKFCNSIIYILDHKYYYDYEKYYKLIEKLSLRITSLIAKSMKELLDNTTILCKEIYQKQMNVILKLNKSTQSISNNNAVAIYDDQQQPLESSPIYAKFRGLSYRMKELNNLLYWSSNIHYYASLANSSDTSSSSSSDSKNHYIPLKLQVDKSIYLPFHHQLEEIIYNIKQDYILIRCELLNPLIKHQITMFKLNKDISQNLCLIIRKTYSTLIRITQLEQQLSYSLFRRSESSTVPSTPMTASADSADSEVDVNKRIHDEVTMNDEISSIIQSICNTTNDCLRPFIIHESNIDELCKVINILSEDIKSQIVASSSLTAASPTTPSSSTTHVSKKLIDFLLKSLDRSMSDTQERLVYCAEVRLRQDIQLFEPLPHHLLYPEILQDITTTTGTINQSSDFDSSDITKTWYPTLKSTLMLLSKLYGIIDMNIFEDFSRRAISICISTLLNVSDMIEKRHNIMYKKVHKNLFLIKHFLILREQLLPFEIKFKYLEKKLNFQTTNNVIRKMFQSNVLKSAVDQNGSITGAIISSLLRFDTSNIFLRWTIDSIPNIEESSIDIKEELDINLKNSCILLKDYVITLLLNDLESYLNRIKKSCNVTSKTSLLDQTLTNDLVTKLKKELTISSLKSILLNTQQIVIELTNDFKDTLKLYVENSVARVVLLKPIQQDVEIIKLQLEYVIDNIFEVNQTTIEIKQLLQSIISTLISELSK